MALELFDLGHYAIHPRNQGGLGDDDHEVLPRATREYLVIATNDSRDFTSLVAREEIHPGLIILPCASRARSKELLLAAILHLEGLGEPNELMVNNVLEVKEGGGGQPDMNYYPLSS